MSAHFFYVNMIVKQDEDSSVKPIFLKTVLYFLSDTELEEIQIYISEFFRVDLQGKILKKKGREGFIWRVKCPSNYF